MVPGGGRMTFRLEMEVADMPYGDRQGGIRDPHGNVWWVSQRLVHGPYSA